MASRLVTGLASDTFIAGGGATIPALSKELPTMTAINYEVSRLVANKVTASYNPLKKGVLIAAPNTFVIVGDDQKGFMHDYYFRIHVEPTEIDFQTVAASQSRRVSVWNAFPDISAQMASIDIDRPQGLSVEGHDVPLSIDALGELSFNVVVGVSGPPSINANIQFSFDTVPNPSEISVKGTRAVKFDIVPEVPVVEKWEWLTDIIQAIDSTEQRISLRGEFPRITQQTKIIFTSSEEIRKFYSDVAVSVGRLWLPMFQHTARISKQSLAGTARIYFDTSRIDIREGEYVLLKEKDFGILAEISKMEIDGATLTSELTATINEAALIVPGAPALIDDSTRLKRAAVNQVAEVALNAKMQVIRTSLPRPGSTVSLTMFDGLPILEKRPLANGTVDDAFATGQETFDNQTGRVDVGSRWDYTRVAGDRDFKIDRILNPEQLDFWKLFLAHCKGSAFKFYMPTFRNDLELANSVNEGANAFTAKGSEYGEKLHTLPTHRVLEFETAGGMHRAKVVSAAAGNGVSFVTFAPSLPNDKAFADIKRIGFLIPTRLANDAVNFKHYGLESILSISTISAEQT